MNTRLGDSLYGRVESGLQDEHPRLPEASRVGQGQSTLKTWAWGWARTWASPPEVEGKGEREEVVRPKVQNSAQGPGLKVLVAQAQEGLGWVVEKFPAYVGWQAGYSLLSGGV